MVGALNAAAESWFRYMASATIQGTFLAALILAVVGFGRRWSPALRHGLLMLALLKFAVPPTFNLPTGLFSQLRPARSEAAASRVQGISPAVQRALWPEPPAAAGRVRGTGPAQVDPVPASPPVPVRAVSSDVPEPLSTRGRLMLLQFAGALVILIMVVRQHLRLRRIRSSAVPASDPDLLSEYSSLCSRLRLRRKPALLIAEGRNAPAAFGVWHRVILFPRSLVEALTLTETSVILGHELAHHSRRDFWFHWLQVPVAAMWWFHPAYWLLSRELRSVREDCCDDLVVSRGLAARDTYCGVLLQAARIAWGNAVSGPLFSSIGESRPMRRRFRRLLSAEFSPGPRLATGGFLLLACLGLILLPGIKPGRLRRTYDCPCGPSDEIRTALASLPDMHDMRIPREERLRPLRALAERYPRDIFVQMRLQDSFAGISTLYPEIEEAFALYRSRPGDPLSRYLDARLTGTFDVTAAERKLDELLVDDPGFTWAYFELARVTDTPGFRDPEKAERNLRTFLDACPESLEGYSMLRTVDDVDMIREGAKTFRQLLEARIDSTSLPYWWDLWDLEFRAARKGSQERVIRRVNADIAAMQGVPLQPKYQWYRTYLRALQLTNDDADFAWICEKAKTFQPYVEPQGAGIGPCSEAVNASFDSPDTDRLPLPERLDLVDRAIESRGKWPDCISDEDPPFAIQLARQYVKWQARLDEIPELEQQALREAQVRPRYDRTGRYNPVAEARAEGNLLIAEAYLLQDKLDLAQETMRRSMSELAPGSQWLWDWRSVQARIAGIEGSPIETPEPAPATPEPMFRRRLKYQEPLADFKAKDLQGRTWRLDDLKGKAILINTWSAEGGLLDDHASLEAFYERIKDRKDIQILTFCRDLNPYLAERHIRKHGYTFPTIISRTLVERLFPDSGRPGPMRWWIIDAQGRRSSPFRFVNPGVTLLEMAAAASQ